MCARCKFDREFFSRLHSSIRWKICFLCRHDIAETVYDEDAEGDYALAGLGQDEIFYVCFCCEMLGKLKGVNRIFLNYIPEVFV